MIRFNFGLKHLCIISFVLFAVDFLGFGWYILGGTLLLTVFYLMVCGKRVAVDGLLVWVALLAVSNFFIMYFNSKADIVTKIMKYLVLPLGGYFIGSAFAADEKDESGILKLYLYAVVPLFIHGALNILLFDGVEGTNREVADFWTGIMWKATLACTHFAMAVPLAFLAFTKKGIVKKLLFFALTAASVYASYVTASRTVILIGAIVLALEFFLYFVTNKEISLRRKTIAFIALLAGAAVIAVIIWANMDTLSSSYFFRRMFESDVTEEPRIQLFRNIIENTVYYPFGNMPYFYSHNTWLDFLRESGWITFICFGAITLIALKNLLSVYKNDRISKVDRIAVVGIMSALLIQMFVEPIMDGAPILFCLFFYLIGVNNGLVNKRKREIKNV